MANIKMYKYKPLNESILEKTKEILENDSSSEIIGYEQNGTTYTIRCKSNRDKVSFLISYGKVKPNRCYNKMQNEYDDTILSEDIIHMQHQFVFVVYKDQVLCSNHNKRNLIFSYLNSINKDFSCILLPEAKTVDDFVRDVKTIENISIKATNDLFLREFLNPSWDEDFDEKEVPETIDVKIEFKRALNSNYIRKMYKKLNEKSYIASFDISGETQDGFLSINEVGIIQKKNYFLDNDEGNYDLDEIFIKI